MKRWAFSVGTAAIIAAVLIACRNAPVDTPAEDASYRMRPGYVIDSVRPIEVDLARFRENAGPAPTQLTGGAESFEALLTRFAQAVEGKDMVALERMQISAAEFAWLIYPSSPYTGPPYRQAPQVAWMLSRQSGDVGLKRLVARRGGSPLRILGRQCDPEPSVEGENTLWRRCRVKTLAGADTTMERLFGVVIERGGHFKFASYANQY